MILVLDKFCLLGMICVLVHIPILNFIDVVQKPQNSTGITQNMLHRASVLTSLLFSCFDSLLLNTSASAAFSGTDLTLVLNYWSKVPPKQFLNKMKKTTPEDHLKQFFSI